MRALLRTGYAIQAASALTLVAQNILAPRLMGAEHYGTAVSLLALPLLLQGVVEPMVNGTAIAARSRPDHWVVVRQVWLQLGALAPIGAMGVVVLGAKRQADVVQLALLGAFVIFVLANTALRGIAFAGQRHMTLAAHYVIGLVASLASIPLLMHWVASGYLAMMCLVQVAVLGTLLADSGLREEARRILFTSSASSGFAFVRTYLANLAPRASAMALGPGLLVVASAQLSAAGLAEFKVCQTLAGALAYVLPLNPALLQSHAAAIRRAGANARPSVETYGVRALIFGALMVGFAAAIIWLLYPQIASFLLAQAGNAYHIQFRALIWAAPFFVAAPLLSSMLLGLGLETMTLSINALCVVATLLVAVFVGAAAAFVLGSMLAAIWPAVVGWRLGFLRRRG